jgi:hypothetical protein
LSVFVVDRRKRPLMPCCEKRARLLLEHGRAVVHRRYPFAIRLKDRVVGEVQPIRVKLDPGSKATFAGRLIAATHTVKKIFSVWDCTGS